MTTREMCIEAWKNFDHDACDENGCSKMSPEVSLGMEMTAERCDEDGPWSVQVEIGLREWEIKMLTAELEILRRIEREEKGK